VWIPSLLCFVQVPPGQVWLEGDNPFNSTDSRTYGPVPLALVRGVVRFKVRMM
jgi:type IV secretory pathway protease TraF